MFDNKDKQLADLEAAYTAFMKTMQGLSAKSLLTSLVTGLRATLRRISSAGIESPWQDAVPCAKVRSLFTFMMEQTTTERSTRSSSSSFHPLTAKSC